MWINLIQKISLKRRENRSSEKSESLTDFQWLTALLIPARCNWRLRHNDNWHSEARWFWFHFSELTLTIDEFSDRYLNGAVLALVNQVDVDGLALAAKANLQCCWYCCNYSKRVLNLFTSDAKIAESAKPDDDRYSFIINPAASTSIVDALKGLFADQSELTKQYKRGLMGKSAGGEWYRAQNIYSHTSGQRGGTPLMNGSTSSGASTLVTDGWTAAAANRVKSWWRFLDC